MQLTKSFTAREVVCRCGCGLLPTADAMDALQRMRDLVGRPMVINSGARCATHNISIGGVPSSKHVECMAFDIACRSMLDRYEVVAAAIDVGFKGIGIEDNFVHVDLRTSKPVFWLY